jgi:Ca-activated chloride channel family protein
MLPGSVCLISAVVMFVMPIEFTQPTWLLLLIPAGMMLCWWFARSLSDFSRAQRVASLVVRGGICLLLTLALAGMTWLGNSDEPFVVFLVDRSASIGAAGRAHAEAYLREAESVRGGHGTAWMSYALGTDRPVSDWPDYEASLVAVAITDGGQTDAVAGGNSAVKVGGGTKAVDGSERAEWERGTDLAGAVRTAAAFAPAGYVPRIVLLTDGNETVGDIRSVAPVVGIPLWTVPLPGREEPEVQVSEVRVPTEVREGEPFAVEVVISSSHADEGLIEIYRGDYRVVSERRPLVAGENRFRFEQTVERDRIAAFRARVSGLKQDTLIDNNSDVGLVYAAGKPRVLLAESAPELIQDLAFALEDEGIQVDVRPVEGIPETLEGLQNYELLILSNVPATKLTSGQMSVIQGWVQDSGGGFLMLGGEQSFGPGGYYRSAIEEILPLRSDFEKEQEKPGLGMVLVIDRSGSMEGDKLEMARTAARSAVELLSSRDQVAVLAFDDQAWVISEMQSAGNRGRISEQIGRIQPGGGTSMYPAMEMANEMLGNTSARLKHVIMLTDGISNSGSFEQLARQMASAKITVSVVALGAEDATDTTLLKSIAKLGKGRFYLAEDPAQVPQIFARETMTAGKSAMEEEPFVPQVMRATRVLADIDLENAPLLLGYVVTRPKPGSEVILATEKGDPLLAWWRYGLGMTGAFTSDAKSRWAAEWLTWPGYGKFWTQVVRQLMRKSAAGGLQATIERRGSQSRLIVDATTAAGEFLNEAEAEVQVVNPRGQKVRVPLVQQRPGSYVADLETAESGSWNLDISMRRDGQIVAQQSRAVHVGDQEELRLKAVNTELLRELATSTGGRFDAPATEVFERSGDRVSRPRPLRTALLVLATLMLIPDVALRRLEFSWRRTGRWRFTGTRLARGARTAGERA